MVAAPEPLAEIRAADALALMRVAWHLGNRHLPTELMPKALRIRRDPVIEDMAKGLGARVTPVEAPFNPEAAPMSRRRRHRHRPSMLITATTTTRMRTSTPITATIIPITAMNDHEHCDHPDHRHGHDHDHGHDGHDHGQPLSPTARSCP